MGPWVVLQTLKKRSCKLSADFVSPLNQLVIYHLLCQTQKVMLSKFPEYHFRKLFGSTRNQRIGNRSQTHIVGEEQEIHVSNNSATIVDYKKSISRGTFFYQSSKWWNSLPVNIRNLEKDKPFKKAVKLWVSQHVRPFK